VECRRGARLRADGRVGSGHVDRGGHGAGVCARGRMPARPGYPQLRQAIRSDTAGMASSPS
jgi:hypothetical protein